MTTADNFVVAGELVLKPGPGFSTPLFVSRLSNKMWIQSIDADDIIENFNFVEERKLLEVQYIKSAIRRNIGDLALYIYNDSNNNSLIATKNDLKEYLIRDYNNLSRFPYLQRTIATFVDDTNLLSRSNLAIERRQIARSQKIQDTVSFTKRRIEVSANRIPNSDSTRPIWEPDNSYISRLPRKAVILISYSHQDEPEQPAEGEVRWLSFVVGHLRPAAKHGRVEIWLDRLTEGGTDWEREIDRKLRACDVFVLLVSHHAMVSSDVVDREIAIIRERQANGEDVHFYPLLLTPTPKIALERVSDRNLRPRVGQPFSKFALYERHEKMCEAADEIVEIANRIAARNGSPAVPSKKQESAATDIVAPDSLWAWLGGQRSEIALAIEARCALRMVPLARAGRPNFGDAEEMQSFFALTSAMFRYCAAAWVAGKYPAREKFFVATETVGGERGVSVAVVALTDSATEPISADVEFAATDVLAELSVDVATIQSLGAISLSDLPLWSTGMPEWARDAWSALKVGLPTEDNWDVWFRWYEDRLSGNSHGEAHEIVYTDVPLEVWKQSPAAGNAWIGAHLPRDPAPASDCPPPLPDLNSPFTYAWTAALRVAAVAGPHNLPFYPFFDSEEHHARALEVCRKGAERLLKALQEGSRYNVRPEYAEALRHYVKDLPKVAGEGNILLANDQAVNLREMFAQDLETLPAGFASPLRRVIENQFALNAFYDLVKRHQDAIAASKLTLRFPAEAARRFFRVVEAETPRFFEPPVGEGLREVERAAPPAALAPDEARPSTAIQPPPLPPGTPDPRQSHERQIATAVNALWETFLKGKDLPVEAKAWTEAAQKLGHAVGPLLDFLRGLGS